MRIDRRVGRGGGSPRPFTLKQAAWLLLALLVLPVSAHAAEAKPHPTKQKPQQAAQQKPQREPDKCIAKICLESAVTQAEIVERYGPGREEAPYPSEPGHVHRCYYDPRQQLYIEFDFDKAQQHHMAHHSDLVEIMVSQAPMCEQKYTPRHPFPPFVTEHGVGIGTTKAKLRAAMGKPNETKNMVRLERLNAKHRTHAQLMSDHESSTYGERALAYNPDPEHELLQDVFYISHGKVKSILLTDSE